MKQLKAFKVGDRKNPLMSAMASQLSDTDIENLAAPQADTSYLFLLKNIQAKAGAK